MNIEKLENEGFKRQSDMLLIALELCSWENRRNLGYLLRHPGVRKSRFKKGEEWTRNVAGITFRLKSGERKFGEAPYFHRLNVVCPCCSREVPYGRLHQHAIVHVVGRLVELRHPDDGPLRLKSVWHERWQVTEEGGFRRKPSCIQYGFHLSAGF
jgi:hypothetical protein